MSYAKIIITLIGGIMISKAYAFSYLASDYKWAKSNIPVKYYLENKGTAENNAIKESFDTWENVSNQYLEFSYMGTTTQSSWGRDYKNICIAIELGWPPEWGPKVLAVTVVNVGSTTNVTEIVDTDILFNWQDFPWSTSGESGKVDIQNVATHEIGHIVGLNDLYDSADSEATMYFEANYGETKKRDLENDDKNGIRFIYPVFGGGTGDVPSESVLLINNLINVNRNESCQISFQLSETKKVEINIYTIDGELVKEVTNSVYLSGAHVIFWDGENDHGSNVGAGIYLVKLNISDKIYKIAVIK